MSTERSVRVPRTPRLSRVSRRARGGLASLIAGLACTSALAVPLAPLVNEVDLVADATARATQIPLAQTVSITQAGSYVIAVTDLQSPTALAALDVAIANPAGPATALQAAGTSVTATVALSAGIYTVQPIVATAAGSLGGSFSVVITAQGSSTALWQNTWTVAAGISTVPAGQSALFTQFTVTDPGSYQLVLTDQAFPVALAATSIIILPHGGASPVYYQSGGPTTFQLPSGTFDLVVAAQADAVALMGLYSLKIVGGSAGTSIAYAATTPVGQLTPALSATIPAAETVTLRLNDLGAPKPLASLRALWVQGADVLQSVSAAGAYPASAAQGASQVFVAASPDVTAGEGAYGLTIADASSILLDSAQPVVDTAHVGFALSVPTALASGNYQVALTDLQLPAKLSALHTLVEQQANLLGDVTATSTVAAQAGALNFVVFATAPATGTAGLFGLQVTAAGAASALYQTTQGVGALFRSLTVHVPAAGNYLLRLDDLGLASTTSPAPFPAPFAELWLIATSGQATVGQLVGTAKLTLTAPAAGDYVLNVIAQVGTGSDYGWYGVNLDSAPPAPTVTLTASSSSVGVGAHATLTWSSTNATTCTASGGWSGALATSGSQDSGAVNAATTYTLTCSGDGGSGMASVNIAVASASHGGGGALTAPTILVLGIAAFAAARRRRAASDRAASAATGGMNGNC